MLLSTATRLMEWQDPVTFWTAAVAAHPQKPRPWHNLGVARWHAGDTRGAERALRRAVALSASPLRRRLEGPWFHENAVFALAVLLAERGAYQEALDLTAQIPRQTNRTRLSIAEQTWHTALRSPPSGVLVF